MLGKDDSFDVGITGLKTKTGISKLYFKPITEEIINIKDNTLAVEVSELHIDGGNRHYYNPFNIYIGEVHTILELMMNGDKVYADWREDPKSIDISKDVVCYKNDKGQNVVYAYLCDSDIVVKNAEELKEVLKNISNSVIAIRNSSSKIKKLSYKDKEN